MRIERSVVRKAGRKGGRGLEKLIDRYVGLNVCVDVDAPVFQKNTEAPEVGFDGREGDLVKNVEVHGGIVQLKELAALGIAVAVYRMIRVQSNPLVSRLGLDKLLGRVADIDDLGDLALAHTHLCVDAIVNLSREVVCRLFQDCIPLQRSSPSHWKQSLQNHNPIVYSYTWELYHTPT